MGIAEELELLLNRWGSLLSELPERDGEQTFVVTQGTLRRKGRLLIDEN